MEQYTQSIFFGIGLTLGAYLIGAALKQRFKLSLFNPPHFQYPGHCHPPSIQHRLCCLHEGRSVYQLSPDSGHRLPGGAPYEKLAVLRANLKAILIGTAAGVLTSLLMALVFSILFGFTHTEYVTILPKSITSPIGFGLAEELMGNPAITVALIVITGIFGNLIAEPVVKLLHLKSPVSVGIAIGTSAHVIGTTKAMEMGETEGAMSSLAITVAGLMTVFAASFFAGLY